MIRTKNIIAVLLPFFLVFSAGACSKQTEKPAPKSEEGPPEQPEVIKELENDILKIMTLADKVPYFERVIVEKEKIEEEKRKEMEKKQESEPSQGSQSSEGQSQDESSKGEESQKQGEPQEEEKPKPMTIEESILDEILKREKTDTEEGKEEEKPPKDITETWQKINATIKGVHDKWNVLEPLLIQESMSPEIISEFEDTLDVLTNVAIQNRYLETLASSNKLTFHLPKFMAVFKKKVPPAVFTLKYLVRDAVLDSAVGNYSKAQESLDKIKEQGQSIKSQLIEKKAKSTADKFDASVNNLQKSLDKKDINLIKINGAIVMKNVMLMNDDLAGLS